MECLGTIIRSGTRFTYYKDEQGGIWFEDEPVKGKPEWMQRADRERKNVMESIMNEFSEYICDHLCKYPEQIKDQEELEEHCAEHCEHGRFHCAVLNEYNEINNFGHSQAAKLINKYKNIVFCEECEDRWYSKSDEASYCCSIDGICRALKPGDGCSCGRRKE